MRKASLIAVLISACMVFNIPVSAQAAEAYKEDMTGISGSVMAGTEEMDMTVSTAASGFEWEGTKIKKYTGTKSEIVIPAKATAIMKEAFANTAVTTVDFRQSKVTVIGTGAFQDCKSLQKVYLNTLTSDIKSNAFRGCTNLKSCNFSSASSLVYIRSKAFYNTGLSIVTLPAKVNFIGANAFSKCSRLKTFKLNKLLLNSGSVNDPVFRNCQLMKTAGTADTDNFIFPTGTTKIPEKLFKGCNSLTTVRFPSQLAQIGGEAFSDCTSLNKVYVNKSLVNTVNSGLVSTTDIFNENCTGLKTLGTASTCSIVLPSGTTRIPGFIFHRTALTTVTLPSSVTKIESNAFDYCPNLTKVVLNANLKSIGLSAFDGCSKLTSCNFKAAERLTEIGPNAFNACNLATVRLGSKMASLGVFSFNANNRLSDIYLYNENVISPWIGIGNTDTVFHVYRNSDTARSLKQAGRKVVYLAE